MQSWSGTYTFFLFYSCNIRHLTDQHRTLKKGAISPKTDAIFARSFKTSFSYTSSRRADNPVTNRFVCKSPGSCLEDNFMKHLRVPEIAKALVNESTQ